MALTNIQRVGKMFELLAPPLETFIEQTVAPELPEGASWVHLVELRDKDNGITGKSYHPGDPHVQLRLITEGITNQVKRGWWPFRAVLSRVHESYASELRDYRNAWAHNKPFSDDDAYRALDTAERLLAAIGSPDAADEVRALRLSLRRVTAEKDDRRTIRNAVVSPESAGLRPWREVLPPHHDVATGNFQAAEFAADLYQVANTPDQNRDYSDPVQFFARTYLTDGLRDLIGRAVRRLRGDLNASPVINLQTNFGGGKTHSMLALWHLAAGRSLTEFPQDVQELLAENGYDGVPATVRRVALVGQHVAPSGQTKPDGTRVNTLWGELAWQLGGVEAFELVRASDESGTAPGSALHDLLARYGPAVILIDEWVAYARQLLSPNPKAGGEFDTQFTFAQSLTEAVAATPGVILAISIPASHDPSEDGAAVAGNAEEVGGAHGVEALKRLQNVERRVADQWRPASSDEAYHIVRQRLFTTPDSSALAEIGQVARRFGEMYRKHGTEFPSDARDVAYEERIRRTYPIHPELFDRLYEDWSSLERFQRTRGVLRLMNVVIHALWVGDDSSPLILPASVPLAAAQVNAELTQYLQDSWKPVIDADVDGANSEPAHIDAEKPLFGQRSVTKRLARTVFIGSAPTIGSSHKGIETQRVFLGTAVPGDVPGNFHSALTALGDRATYFYSGSGKYWYDLQANITRRAKDQAERLHPEDVWAEIARRLQVQSKTRGAFAGVHVGPEDSADIPDTDEARLVILHPRATHKKGDADSAAAEFARKATEHRGAANRTFRNMLVYLAPDGARMAELDTAVRDYLGWTDVVSSSTELDLTQNQRNQALERQRQADSTVSGRLLNTYTWALVPYAPDPAQPFRIDPVKIEGQSESLAERVSRKLGNDGSISVQQAAGMIRLQLDRIGNLWQQGHVSVGDLWRVYASYPYMPRLRDQQVFNEGLLEQPLVWDTSGFALAAGYDESSDTYRTLWLPDDTTRVVVSDATLIVKPAPARTQRDAEEAERRRRDSTGTDGQGSDRSSSGTGPSGGTGTPTAGGSGGTTTGPTGPAAKTRYFGTKELGAASLGLDFKKIHDEVLAHLATPGVQLTVRIDIEAVDPGGFDDAKVRVVGENSSTLKFEQSGFEEG
ncbi:Swt1 family HEPN domain-containing protein [Occultella kanbiaonis]|uniref:Swt1 family HEPN domain-containing protein n=1 Tax=Occultella kanbiaonis TaxID=2675754 RepID=UPI0013D16D96|nr:Swt1 family HEPN domain-containing protein [Occultella kanbiaonis]